MREKLKKHNIVSPELYLEPALLCFASQNFRIDFFLHFYHLISTHRDVTPLEEGLFGIMSSTPVSEKVKEESKDSTKSSSST